MKFIHHSFFMETVILLPISQNFVQLTKVIES